MTSAPSGAPTRTFPRHGEVPSRRGGTKDPLAHAFVAGRDDAALAALNAAFIDEQARYRLAFQCLDCEHHIEAQDGAPGRCSLEYPSADLQAVLETGVVLAGSGHTWFCKQFEPL